MKVAVFDPVSGASGDMILGALVDAGALVSDIQIELDKLALPVRLIADPVEQSAVRGIRVTVDADDKEHARPWRVIHDLIEHSSFGDRVRRRALAIFTRLAEAEAFVHDSPVDDVHFHEIGGLDTIADICGTCIGLEILAIEQIYCGPLRIGSGFVRAAHGILPVPAPGTARLIAESNAPISTEFPAGTESPGELLTPTGAAILTTLSSFEPVQCSTRAIGYGFGTRELPWPNALRVWIGEAAQLSAPEDSGELIIETNLDDMSPQHVELLVERLFETGSLDVWLTPIVMKKGRPATMVSALLPATRRAEIESVMIQNSTTLGVRVTRVDRTKAQRRFEMVITRWGDVSVKLRGWNGRVIDVAPEYDDCARIARAADIPLRDVWNEAHRVAESYVGRLLSSFAESSEITSIKSHQRR